MFAHHEKIKADAAQFIHYEKDRKNRIATITFDRPDKHNATGIGMRMHYADMVRKAHIDDEVKVLLIRGVGDHFGAGGDLPEESVIVKETVNAEEDSLLPIMEIDDPDVVYPAKGKYRYLFGLTDYYATARSGCRPLQECKKITIIEAKGYVYGWHFYQAADADLIVSSEEALFGHPSFRYAGWGPRMWQWAEMMGLRKFQEMVFTGRPFSAKEMYDCNFVNSVVRRDQLEDEVMKYALACSRSRPTDVVVAQKSFFTIYKQFRGEYLGSQLTGMLEGLLPAMRNDDELDVQLGEAAFSKGLNNTVKDFDENFPPEWRLSLGGRKKNA